MIDIVATVSSIVSSARDAFANMATNPPAENFDSAAAQLATLPATEQAKNIAKAIFLPWTKQLDNGHANTHVAKYVAGAFWAFCAGSLLIAIREAYYLKPNEKSLKGQLVLITGGASGIGKLMAERLALLEKCKVAIWDINQELLTATVAEIAAKGGDIRGYKVDVSNREQVHTTARIMEQDFGATVDIVLNNAGIVGGKPILESDERVMEKVVAVNLNSLFYTTKAFLPAMIQKKHGHIVCVSSATALAGVPRMTEYTASKFGSFGFMEALRLECKQDFPFVRTTIVCPYYINTGLFDGVETKFPRLLPILDPQYVADKIVQGIKRDEELIVLPRFCYSSYFFRLVAPVWLMDSVAGYFGLLDSMKSFKGKKPEERLENLRRVKSAPASVAEAATCQC